MKAEEDITEGGAEVLVLLADLIHVHLSQLQLDVSPVVLEVANDLGLVIGSVPLDLALDLGDLPLRLVGAVGDILVQALENGDNAVDAVHDVIVIAAVKRLNSRVEALLDAVVARDAEGNLITVFLTSETLNDASDHAFELVLIAMRHWMPLGCALHGLVLVGEEVADEGDTSSLVLALLLELLHVIVGRKGVCEECPRTILPQAVPLLLPLLRVEKSLKVLQAVPLGSSDAAKTGHEIAGFLTVLHLVDGDSVFPVDEFPTLLIFLEISETLVLIEGVPDGIPGDYFVVPCGLSEHLSEAVFVDFSGNPLSPGALCQ